MRSSEFKSALIVTLLSMILLRLVWMDIRSYVVTYAPENRHALDQSEASGSCRRSLNLKQLGPDKATQESWQRPGWADSLLYQKLILASCRNGVLNEASFVRYNQGLLIACLVCCVLLTRIMARSWIVGLVVAVALLSRGRLISANGQISGAALMALGYALWALCLGHWLRSGSWWIHLASYFVVAVLMTLDPGAALLGLAPPLVMTLWRPILRHKMQRPAPPTQPVIRDVRLWKRWGVLLNLSLGPTPDASPSGGLFRPLPDGIRVLVGQPPFQHAFKIFTGLGLALSGIMLLMQIAVGKFGPLPLNPLTVDGIGRWLHDFFSPLDRDSGLGILMMLLALTWRSRWLPYLRPLVNLVAVGILLCALGSGLLDMIHLPASAERLWLGTRLLLLWEPVLMTLGMLAFYQMLLSLLSRLDRIPRLTRLLKALR